VTPPIAASRGNLINARGGCQCKLPGMDLQDLLDQAGSRPAGQGANFKAIEDCGVILYAGSILLLTTDINTLVGTDYFDAGRIAALHALSDVWACGGTPLSATVNLILNPDETLQHRIAILKGIKEACDAEHTLILGGHTVYGLETMAGLSVVGAVATGRPISKRACSPGDSLLLSKAAGVGLALRAYRFGVVGAEALDEAVRVMTTANRRASEIAVAAHCHAMTDVTGFGLLGHLAEMLGPGQGAEIELAHVPVLGSVRGLPRSITNTEWIANNYDYAVSRHRLTGITDAHLLAPLLDPQTNGGLLIAVSQADELSVEAGGFIRIGRVVPGENINVC
jgi:selenide, water dikinase